MFESLLLQSLDEDFPCYVAASLAMSAPRHPRTQKPRVQIAENFVVTMKEKEEKEGRLRRLQVYFLFLFGVVGHALKVVGDDWFVSDNPPVVA